MGRRTANPPSGRYVIYGRHWCFFTQAARALLRAASKEYPALKYKYLEVSRLPAYRKKELEELKYPHSVPVIWHEDVAPDGTKTSSFVGGYTELSKVSVFI